MKYLGSKRKQNGYDCPLDSSPQEIYNIARQHYMSF